MGNDGYINFGGVILDSYQISKKSTFVDKNGQKRYNVIFKSGQEVSYTGATVKGASIRSSHKDYLVDRTYTTIDGVKGLTVRVDRGRKGYGKLTSMRIIDSSVICVDLHNGGKDELRMYRCEGELKKCKDGYKYYEDIKVFGNKVDDIRYEGGHTPKIDRYKYI